MLSKRRERVLLSYGVRRKVDEVSEGREEEAVWNSNNAGLKRGTD